WSKVETDANLIEKYGAFLPKAEPPRGDQASYQKLARAYEKNAKALKAGAADHDHAKAKDAPKKLGGSCKACHDAHKESCLFVGWRRPTTGAEMPQGAIPTSSWHAPRPVEPCDHLRRAERLRPEPHRDPSTTMQVPLISHKAARFTESV